MKSYKRGPKMLSEKVARTLKNLGLTEYEARAYTGLVSVGPTGAGELSDTSNVPYSRIYDVLSKLERKGWIEVQSGRPTRYNAKSPSEALRLAQIEHEQEFKEASETILKELEPIYEQKAEMKKPDIWVIRGTRNLIGKIGEMFARAQIEILITIPILTKELAELQNFFPLLEAKNLKLRMLTSKKGRFAKKLRSVPNLEIRYREPLFGGGIIVDSREVLLVLGDARERLGIWSDEVGLTKFAKEYFEYLWKDSKVK
jgi:sugar-specific transcriptional regulator TrmB